MEKNNLILFSLMICGSALLACQPTVNNYEKFLNSWIGQSEAQLVTTWGAPADMQTLGQNRQLFTYIFQKQVLADGQTPIDLGPNSLYSNQNDALGMTYEYYCKTTFTTQDDIIVDYSWSGDACLMK